ncbi:histone acetyltransferase HAC1-like isoform X2 [Cucurbita maxima]|uniref:histone acetyltransferase n=1 Tax=Cucurbita maxima TaxID=3661 RepID=A0A6J1L3J8_CUCMA|nr:histone acetyltransferase HAC1-like isoform X2 [Cucurbita maxima]
MDTELYKARVFIQEKIFEILLQRHQRPIDELQRLKFKDFVKRLEEGIFKTALTKDDYMNLDTLESRLHNLLKRSSLNNQNQQYQQVVSSSSAISQMIPTPGMAHSGNSKMMVASSGDSIISANASLAPMTASTGSIMPTGGINGGSFNRADGPLSSGYQQSSSYSVGSGGVISSAGAQRIASQMIPTPGFSNNINHISSNQSYVSRESSSNGSGLPSVEPTVLSQVQLQKQHIGGQNSRISHNLGSQMGSGIRSSLQQKSYGFTNGAVNGSLGLIGGNVQLLKESSTSEGYLNVSSYGNLTKPVGQSFDQNEQSLVQGDGYGMNTTDSFGSENLYGPATSVGSMGTHSPLIDGSDKMNFQPSLSSRENIIDSHMQQQFQQQHHQFQPQQPFLQQSSIQEQQIQPQQHLLNNNSISQVQLASNLGSHVKQEPGGEHHSGPFQPQVTEHFPLPETHNQFHQNSSEDCARNAQYLSVSSSHNDICSPHSQSSQQMQQILHPHLLNSNSQNRLNSPAGALSGATLQGQWHPQSQDRNHRPGSIVHEQNVHEFHKKASGHDKVQCDNLPTEGSTIGHSVVTRTKSEPPNPLSVTCQNNNSARQFINQQRWLLFLRHARRCVAPEGKCPERNCVTAQKLWQHLDRCSSSQCSYLRCQPTKLLLHHHKRCRDLSCPVCIPVRDYIQSRKNVRAHNSSDSSLQKLNNGFPKSCDTQDNSTRFVSKTLQPTETSKDLQSSLKRMKIEQSTQSLVPESESSAISNSAMSEHHMSLDVQCQGYQHSDVTMAVKHEIVDVKMDLLQSSTLESHSDLKDANADNNCSQRCDVDLVTYDEFSSLPKQENVKIEKETEPSVQDPSTHVTEHAAATKSGKPKIKGVSLTELFTPEQVRDHIISLRQWVGQSKSKAEKNQAMEQSMSENSCQLCAVEKLTFEPPPIYCTPCGARIKRNAMYHTVGAGDTRHYFCIPCYNDARGDAIVVDGTAIPKSRLEKKKNDEETEEWWVQCDKCEAWQHQICALFNGRRNDGGQAEYTCPNCYIQEIERGERIPLPQSAVLGAKDLPRTILSDHIEQRLARRLKHERLERARIQGKSYDEVPGADGLVIRVVSSVDKKLEVKQRFLEIFQEENYPFEFPYKSKAVLLFQKIEGVEVCLFGMYVQEFGSECQFPNQRRVYLSYLDSVKYFRPEIKTYNGEALRTFVYHEILIGYLEYCKKRGFTSCYIWACPPLKGEDYILYCHPEIQKTPKSDKLREWYLSMLRKAAKENIVVDLTNLYDHFFVSTGECKAKVTAARLPYFDGDYWPGTAEDLIYQLRQEEDGRKQNKKGMTKKTITKRALKASGQSDLSGNASKDLLLMHKLGETISPMKEDFIMVHLQHACSHCCILMVSGSRWVCNQCKNFQLCDKCYEAEQKREEREKHPINQREKHSLYPDEISDVPVDTKDKDEILESEFFDTRQAFLSLCQGNHYQYDTLRRAKHSSMMVLYHLHNPTAPAFVTTCNICHLDIETGQGWRCEVCPDYDVCNSCYQKDGGIDHPHKLTNHPSMVDRDAQNKEARQLRVMQLRKMLDLLVHASQCRSAHCQYPNCRKVKGLFRHGIQCKTRASGGCVLCKKMWYLLQLHARACKESQCHVPRCRDLKEHLRRLQQQSDSRRRAAVMEMMRQRAAELNNTG